jgi:DNA (cytosine-5)-methyltransferase 1
MKINQLDLFSGIGGFHLGFERAGYKVTSYFSEIDKHAVAVYKNKFKNSNYVGSVTDVRGAELPKIDLITFGSPCQDFSLAGKRKGMEGDRSSLILEAIRLIGECRPRVFIWENVKGTFSSNSGEDFSAIIQAFANIGGYRLEWQLLNTSWFLPQNRERIYLVGYSTEPKRDWRGVFPIGESNNLSNAMARERQTSACITTSYHKGVNYDNQLIKVKSATSSGYEEATSGDTINLSQPNSETRRGRVGKQKAQTLETSCNQAVVDNYRIRRLTPIECERLQGFPDQHTAFGNYDGEVNPMSNTQRYRQCGNAVTVDVVEAIANKIKPLFK